jgi:hypothetical protein
MIAGNEINFIRQRKAVTICRIGLNLIGGYGAARQEQGQEIV